MNSKIGKTICLIVAVGIISALIYLIVSQAVYARNVEQLKTDIENYSYSTIREFRFERYSYTDPDKDRVCEVDIRIEPRVIRYSNYIVVRYNIIGYYDGDEYNGIIEKFNIEEEFEESILDSMEIAGWMYEEKVQKMADEAGIKVMFTTDNLEIID